MEKPGKSTKTVAKRSRVAKTTRAISAKSPRSKVSRPKKLGRSSFNFSQFYFSKPVTIVLVSTYATVLVVVIATLALSNLLKKDDSGVPETPESEAYAFQPVNEGEIDVPVLGDVEEKTEEDATGDESSENTQTPTISAPAQTPQSRAVSAASSNTTTNTSSTPKASETTSKTSNTAQNQATTTPQTTVKTPETTYTENETAPSSNINYQNDLSDLDFSEGRSESNPTYPDQLPDDYVAPEDDSAEEPSEQ